MKFYKSGPVTIVQNIAAAATPERISATSILTPWFVVTTVEADNDFYIGDSNVDATHTVINDTAPFNWSVPGVLTDLYDWFIKSAADDKDVVIVYGSEPQGPFSVNELKAL